jgi:methyl-accepting chemotaxis protein
MYSSFFLALALGMGFVALNRVSSEIERSGRDSLQTQADRGALAIETWLQQRKLEIAYWAGRDCVREGLQNTPEGTKARATAITLLADLIKQFPVYENIRTIAPDGNVVYSAKDHKDMNLAARAYFQNAMKGQTTVSEVLLSKATGKPFVSVASPMRQQDGTIIGVLYAVVDAAVLTQQSTEASRNWQSGFTVLADGTGRVIAHPDPAKIFEVKLADLEWGSAVKPGAKGIIAYRRGSAD